MKILNITAQKPDSTGSGVYLTEMVKAFDRLGHDQAVIAGIAPGDAPILPEGVRFFPVYYETELLPYPVLGMSDEMPYRATRYCDMVPEMVDQLRAAFEKALSEVLKQFDPDLVICHHLYLVTSIVRNFLPEKKVLAVCHGTDIRQMRKHTLEREWIISSTRKLNAVFALHDAQKEEIAELYGVCADKITVIGTGFDHELFHDRGRNNQDALSNPIKITYVGKIWEKKGVKSLIRSLDLLPYQPEDLVLNLIGGHSHQAEYDAIWALAQASRFDIRFLGKRAQEEVAEAYRQSDLFVLPSFFEGLPLVVIEALACGCRVVVTDLPGIGSWLSKKVAGATIVYVEPPDMVNTDEPEPESIPQFEERLAQAITLALGMSCNTPNMYALSWEALCKELLAHLNK